MANDFAEKIEFIIAIESRIQMKNIKNLLAECQRSFEEYIGITTSFYIGSAESRTNIYKSYSLSQSLSSYAFIYGEGAIIDETTISKMDDEEFDNIRILCDKIKADITGDEDAYKTIWLSLKRAWPEQAHPNVMRFCAIFCLISAPQSRILRESITLRM